jgi:small subunit ribosomal protein S4
MSRYTGPAYKKSRHLGFSTLENGKELAKKPYAPGIHGTDRKRKPSEYSVQLAEKQKIRFMYGLNEKQFRRTFDKAQKMAGIAGENFLMLLESRLDNIVYRLGLAATRPQARQLVTHGNFEVNGHKVDIASYLVKPGDVVAVREIRKDNKIIKNALETTKPVIPEWLDFDEKKLSAKVVRLVKREEIDIPVEEHLIVELYNK